MTDGTQAGGGHPIVVTRGAAPVIRAQVSATGPAGKSAYQYAAEGGYSGNESDFIRCLGSLEAAVCPADTRFEFPNVGREGVLYLDRQENKAYRWEPEAVGYRVVGSDYREIQRIDGGDANG